MGESVGGDAPPPLLPLDLHDLKVVSVLGRGAKGVVFLVHRRSHATEAFAFKAISRSNIQSKSPAKTDGYRRIWLEKDVLSSLHHPLLPSLRGFVSTDEIVGFAIDRCSGGDLNALRRKQTEKMFSEDIIRFYAAELVLALEYLHSLGIVYRDLKPENVLIQANGHLMLVDFDLCTKLPTKTPFPSKPFETVQSPKRSSRRPRRFWSFCGISKHRDQVKSLEENSSPESTSCSSSTTSSLGKSNSFVGTEEYVAPEVIDGTGHDFAVDWWSLGVVLYEMLYGRTPFRGQNRKETFYRILSKPPELVGETTALRDLIGRLLEKDPAKRISCDEIKQHEFFRGVEWESVLRISRPPFIPEAAEAAEEGSGGEGEEEEREAIDVEKFVQGVFGKSAFSRDAAGKDEDNKNGTDTCPKTKGNWVDGLSNKPTPSAEFLVF